MDGRIRFSLLAAQFSLLSLFAAAPSQAAIVSCTPSAGYNTCFRITYSGADQTYTLPANALPNNVKFKLWGAGGGGSTFAGQLGGAGGFTSGILNLTNNRTITIIVGQGGIHAQGVTAYTLTGAENPTYGGGGAGGARINGTVTGWPGGSGGGRSAVRVGAGIANSSASNEVLTAGGGGAASDGTGGTTEQAGVGGGTSGTQGFESVLGFSVYSGGGGTQTAGGAAGTVLGAPISPSGPGTQFQGGAGGCSSANGGECGGGGGGGYFGGGGGGDDGGIRDQPGGGGSGRVDTIVSSGTTTAGTATTPPSTGDTHYVAGIGVGGTSTVGTADGGNGQVIIEFNTSASLTLNKTSVGGTGGFTFTGTNGWTSQTITTVTPGVAVSGATQTLAAAGSATTISETIPAGYVVSAISCSGLGSGGTATPDLATGSVTLNAAAVAVGSNIICSFTNTKLPTLRLSKISNGGVGSFSFSGSNGFGSDSITTLTPGIAANGTLKTLSNFSTATTITETIPSTYFISGISCAGLGSGTATPNLTAGTVLLDASATAPGNTITCTYTNTLSDPRLTVVKSANTVGPVSAGHVITYTFTVTNSGNRPVSGVTLSESFNGFGTPPQPRNETLTNDAAPTGDSSNGTLDDGIWQMLGVGDTVTFTATYTVTQADIDGLQ